MLSQSTIKAAATHDPPPSAVSPPGGMFMMKGILSYRVEFGRTFWVCSSGPKWKNRVQQYGNIPSDHISLHGSISIGSTYGIFMIYLPAFG